MKKSLKNFIMVFMIVVLLGTTTVTCALARQYSSGMTPPSMGQSGSSDSYDFGDFPSNGNSQGGFPGSGSAPQDNFGNDQNSNNSNSNGNNSNSNSKQNGNSNNSNNSNDNSSSSDDSSASDKDKPQSNTESVEPSDMSSSDELTLGDDSSSDELTLGDGSSELESQDVQNAPTQSQGGFSLMSGLLYLFALVQIAIIVLIIIYLIKTKFNELTYEQAFPKKEKVQTPPMFANPMQQQTPPSYSSLDQFNQHQNQNINQGVYIPQQSGNGAVVNSAQGFSAPAQAPVSAPMQEQVTENIPQATNEAVDSIQEITPNDVKDDIFSGDNE